MNRSLLGRRKESQIKKEACLTTAVTSVAKCTRGNWLCLEIKEGFPEEVHLQDEALRMRRTSSSCGSERRVFQVKGTAFPHESSWSSDFFQSYQKSIM